MWASTPTAQNGKRGDFSPDPHVLSNTLCRGEIETQCNNAHPPLRGCFHFGGWVDVGIDPYGMESEIPPHVGADAYIGPLKCCGFALDFRENGRFTAGGQGRPPLRGEKRNPVQ